MMISPYWPATKRSDFDALTEAAIFMSPLLEEQRSRMNMRKTRYMYYGSSAMPERTINSSHQRGRDNTGYQRLNNNW